MWSTGSIQSDPWMQYYNNTLFYGYLEYPSGSIGQGQISMALTNDKGKTWEQVRASYGLGLYADKETFTIDKDGTIYVVYSDVYDIDGESETLVRLSRSFDDGSTFIDNTTINDHKDVDIGAYILSRGKDLMVAWTRYYWPNQLNPPDPNKSTFMIDISHDGGNTFSTDINLIPEYNASYSDRHPDSGRSAKHSLVALDQDASTGRVYATWADVSYNTSAPTKSWDVYFSYSDDFGLSWSKIERVNQLLDANQWNPEVEIDSEGLVHFVYFDESASEGRHVKYRIYSPKTDMFSDEVTVTTSPTDPVFTRPGEYLAIRFDSKDVPNIVWTDHQKCTYNFFNR